MLCMRDLYNACMLLYAFALVLVNLYPMFSQFIELLQGGQYEIISNSHVQSPSRK